MMIEHIGAPELAAFWLTFKLALLTTTILMLISLPLAWWLANSRSWFATIIESVVGLPIVLPPTVLGFYLLIAFSPNTLLGEQYHAITDQQLAFSFTGILLASLIYSLPFAIQPLQTTFSQLDKRLLETAHSLGASPLDSFISIVLPVGKNGIISAALLCFAHTVGEFGVILMIGGNIPGETQVVSIALFDAVESFEYDKAHALAISLLLFSMLVLLSMNLIKKGQQHVTD